MKLLIDTEKKTIQIMESVSIGKLTELISEGIPLNKYRFASPNPNEELESYCNCEDCISKRQNITP